MPDVFTKAKRSDVMSRIRSRGNKDTELALARLLRAHGITGWRRHLKLRAGELRIERSKAGNVQRPASNVGRSKLSVGRWKFSRPFTVRPDFVFPRERVAVFVDGCFWHACPRHGTMPKGNAAFWRRKFAANVARDRRVNRALRSAKWRVVRIWEHEMPKSGKAESGKRKGSAPRPRRNGGKLLRRTSSGLRPPSPQRGEGHLPGRGGEGERKEARLVTRIKKALA